MPARSQDTYFLDRMDAYSAAEQRNLIEENNNDNRLQFCYYDGVPFENAPDNLVHVPFSQFTEFFATTSLPIPTCLYANQEQEQSSQFDQMQSAFRAIIAELKHMRSAYSNPTNTDSQPELLNDTYFFDANLALQTAKERHRVATIHPTIDGLQVCYYDGKAIENPPDNLVHVPLNNALKYFCSTRLRLPSAVIFPPDITYSDREKFAEVFQHLIETAQQQRARASETLIKNNLTIAPPIIANEPLRIFFITSRLTTVMQYATKNLANAFRQLGHETFISIEQNEMESLDSMCHMQSYNDFKPHITININHLNNNFIHPDIFNVIWWQDPMPSIRAGEPLPWRARDIVFSFATSTDEYLENCGAQKVMRQSFCIDPAIFRLYPEIQREDKIVFIGSSYASHLKQSAEYFEIANTLTDYLVSGTPITFNLLKSLSHRFSIQYEEIFWNIFHYVTRDKIVEWICTQQELPVEVFGNGWANNPVVAPFHKGVLNHGTDVARAYNSARYALVTHPFDINSQRFAEAVSCGAVVLMHDCRHCADQPHWENIIQFFNHPQTLQKILAARMGEPHPEISEQFSYKHFAERILNIVNSTLENGKSHE